jgi:flagellar hook-length control protein FliK
MAEGALEPGQIPTPNPTPGAEPDIAGSVNLPDPMRFLTAKPEPTNQDSGTARLHAVFGRNAVPMQESFSFNDAAAFVKAGAVTSSGEVFFLDALPGGARAGQMLDPAPDAVAAMSVDNTFSALSRIMPEAPPTQGADHPIGIGSERLMEQIVQGVRMARQGEASEIVVHLKPDFLGRLTIRVLSDKHVIQVEIKVENEMVRQMMQDNLANLQHRLSEKGVAFDHLGVFAETGSQRDGEPAETAQQLDMRAIGRETEPEAAAGVLGEAPPLTRSGGIDYLA